MNPYRFENQNREIVLSRYNMPTPWMNYLSNGTLHAMISQAGGGVAWYKFLVPFAADLAHQPLPILPPADRPQRILYLHQGRRFRLVPDERTVRM